VPVEVEEDRPDRVAAFGIAKRHAVGEFNSGAPEPKANHRGTSRFPCSSASNADGPADKPIRLVGAFSPVKRHNAVKPSSLPGQWVRTAVRPARRTTLRRTAVMMMASSA
jgi:hypothetical protein